VEDELSLLTIWEDAIESAAQIAYFAENAVVPEEQSHRNRCGDGLSGIRC
jgi:hypothetical protein